MSFFTNTHKFLRRNKNSSNNISNTLQHYFLTSCWVGVVLRQTAIDFPLFSGFIPIFFPLPNIFANKALWTLRNKKYKYPRVITEMCLSCLFHNNCDGRSPWILCVVWEVGKNDLCAFVVRWDIFMFSIWIVIWVICTLILFKNLLLFVLLATKFEFLYIIINQY